MSFMQSKGMSPVQRTSEFYAVPTTAQLKQIYTNPETQNQLTQIAMQTCQQVGIDYRDLLPCHLDNREATL